MAFIKIFFIDKIGFISILCLFLLPSCKKTGENAQAQPTTHVHGIIPLPLSVELAEGNLTIDKNTVLVNNSQFQTAIGVVEDALSGVSNFTIVKKDSPVGKTNISFIADNTMDTSAYQIEINTLGITVKSKSQAGAFYAAQSLRQMIWNSTSGQKSESFTLRLMTIEDKPKYAWRGFHLDVSRHFLVYPQLSSIVV